MATADAFEAQPGATQRSVPLDGFQSVGGATRRKAALTHRAEQKSFRWRNNQTIQPHSKNQDVLCHIHVPLSPFNNPAFRRLVKKSFSTSLKHLPAIEGLAT